MKKKYVLILIIILTVGFASINTVLDLKGNVSIGFKKDDFNVEISKVVIDEGNTPITLSADKQSFTFTGTGNNKIEYRITNKSYQYDANVNLVCEPNNNLLINQVGEVVAQSRKSETIESNTTGSVTCRMDIDKISKTEIAEDMCEYEEGQTWEFNYTGSEQEFIVPCDGNYKIEAWGAQGSGNTSDGYGGYVSGDIQLNEKKSLYVYVGNKPLLGEESYNGGGLSNNNYYPSYNGGGATDIRLTNGNWDNFDSLKSRIMVAGAGGGQIIFLSSNVEGGSAGGLNGYDGKYKMPSGGRNPSYPTGATQIKGGLADKSLYYGEDGSFGKGGHGELAYGGGGGGAGYYGGGGGDNYTHVSSGGGGSSFISGHNGCDAISKDSTDTNIIHTGQPNHYSGYVFTNTVMIDGAGYNWTNVRGSYTGMPSHDGLSTMTGNTGHGYAKITYLG